MIKKRVKGKSPQLQNAMKKVVARLELEQHRRDGHRNFPKECPECRSGMIRQRAHRRQEQHYRPGGELSVDISGPQFPGRMPTDAPEQWARRAQYFVLASYAVFSPAERDEQARNLDFAKLKRGESGDLHRFAPEGAGGQGHPEEPQRLGAAASGLRLRGGGVEDQSHEKEEEHDQTEQHQKTLYVVRFLRPGTATIRFQHCRASPTR